MQVLEQEHERTLGSRCGAQLVPDTAVEPMPLPSLGVDRPLQLLDLEAERPQAATHRAQRLGAGGHRAADPDPRPLHRREQAELPQEA